MRAGVRRVNPGDGDTAMAIDESVRQEREAAQGVMERIVGGLAILFQHGLPVDVSMHPVPNAFPNAAPDHSRRAYMAVQSDVEVDGEPADWLISNGWTREDDGFAWIYYG